ncbi:hypothetical protein CDD80_5798 [Ophiocordyceps camponoti-rufipedis]|uniref:DNA mismatch repair protein S5 domain-containing protein n=1 Tax=Ophiocordyceps camponoti-rufipedis TaxID=2004952 RepID=A0A2C5YTL4_9HYPO|nr:hypothetical protein CDD80_5798 [Ophiocordyceps camponoti-rufipedis]
MAATIKPIERNSVHQIQSGQVIVDLCSVVKELVENSIDAGSTTIDVRFKNQGLDLIEVQDNGAGISPSSHSYVALKHHTSKLTTFSDLASLHSFGFRGEALSSLCALSHLVITTCVEADVPKGSRLSFDPTGVLTDTSVVASPRGTTVSVSGLFHNLPVRRRELERNIKREWQKVCVLLNQYACIQTNVKFSVSQQPSRGNRMVLFSTRGNPTTRGNIINIFGARIMSALVPVDLSLDLHTTASKLDVAAVAGRHTNDCQVRLVGHVSRPSSGDGRQTPDRQMFFVNGRPCGLPQIAKTFNEAYRSYNVSQSPFIFVDVRLDTNRYDVNVSPDKLSVFLHDQDQLLKTLRTSLEDLFESYQSAIPLSQLKDGSRQQRGTDDGTPAPKDSSFMRPGQVPKTRLGTSQSGPETLSPCSPIPIPGARRESRQSTESDESEPAFDHESKGSPARQSLGKIRRVASSSGTDGSHIKTRSNIFNLDTETHADEARPAQSSWVRKGILTTPSALDTAASSLIGLVHHKAQDSVSDTVEESLPPADHLIQETYGPEQVTLSSQPSKPAIHLTTEANGPENAAIGEPLFSRSAIPTGITETRIGEDRGKQNLNPSNPQDAPRSTASRTKDEELTLPQCDSPGNLSNVTPDETEGYTTMPNDHSERTLDETPDPVSISNPADNLISLDDRLRRNSPLTGVTQRIQVKEENVRRYMNNLIFDMLQESDNPQIASIQEEDDAPDAETQLTVTIARDHFSQMRIVGQFNKGFIITVRPAAPRDTDDSRARHDELFILDQHASDEKYNFERLQRSTIVQPQSLALPKSLQLTSLEEEVVSENMAAIEANGFKIGFDTSDACSPGSRCQLLALPLSRDTTFNLDDLEELIAMLGDEPFLSGPIPRPSKVRKI